MKARTVVITILLALVATGCNNFFHELIPPDGNRIKSFYIPGQLDVAIGDTSITVTVPPGMALTKLVPSIQVSAGATLFPVTYEYASRAFGDERIFGVAMELYTSGTNTEKVMEMIRTNKDNFTVPALDLPINFGYPVDFLVISGLGTMRRYTVRIEVDTGEGKFVSFKFDKFFNPDMVRTAAGSIDTSTKTVTIDVSYPVENIALYQLTPSFATNGARVYLDNGTELTSDVSLMDFLKPPDSSDLINPLYASQTTTLTLKRTGYADSVWTLTVNFSEDPDTNRSIIDFRFTKARNPLINADYMAEIVNSGDTGTITVTVYYQGAKPEELRAGFVSPGTVTVQGTTQASGLSMQDFSAPLQYRVTSRVGNYIRDYTVTVQILPISDPLPQITYFGFSTTRNLQLVSDSTAMIDHNNRLILIEAAYDGDTPPNNLLPDFSATGTVTVNGVTHNSGANSVDFSGPVGYVVTNPSNPTLRREYRVEVHFVKNLSSVAEIASFSFYMADNPALIADVHATVNQLTGAITATVLFETPGGSRTLVPRWSAQGRVEAGGVTQTSGLSGRQFYTPQGYRAVSVDGIIQKNYTVTVKEVNSRIYVRQNATGRNDGTNWENAYRNMPGACNDAALFPDYIPKELWIASGTYKPSDTGNRDEYLLLTANTGYIGGFAGHETSKSQRNVAANRVIVSGDLGGGVYSNNLFGAFTAQNNSVSLNGDISFENMEFTAARATTGRIYGGAIFAGTSTGFGMSVTGCAFNNLQANYGGAVYFSFGELVVFDTVIENITAGGAIYGISLSDTTISDVKLQDITGYGIYISSYNSSSRRELSRITGNRISNSGVYVSGSTTLADSNFDASGSIHLRDSFSVNISNIVNKNVNSGNRGVYVSSENINLDRVTVENVLDAQGMYIYSTSGGTILLSGCTVENVSDAQGMYIYSTSGGTILLSGCTIKNVKNNKDNQQGGGLFAYNTGGSFTINNSRFENCTAYTGGAIFLNYGFSSVAITNTDFINCTGRINYKIFSLSLSASPIIRNCRFTHNSNLSNPGASTSSNRGIFFYISGTFEGCTFTNLRSNEAGEQYLFNTWAIYPGSNGGPSKWGGENRNLILRNCTFNFNAGSAGLCALYAQISTGADADYLLMDGVAINNSGGQQPLIWLYGGNTASTFRFRANNVYNGTMLNTATAITGLGTGVIRLQNGAVPTIVP